ncbi:CACTA en-spm transposon protein [Cucumis melo var. makuwa]|uniref:CACTA en-spm transposon protein n=1 Tax=Cucumis melo var. makuwa TaxID=1194695 RepID=A0A5A7TX31_CUCMM|nr:CACTA en-spm transposon protein [Cucumis melo var. makuwa]
MGLSFDVYCYNRCIMGALRFHTSELDSRRTTQNSGVMVIGESDASGSGDNNFYGVLDEVLHVQYPLERNIWLFKNVPEEEDVESNHINVLEILISHQVDDHIEDDTLCRTNIDPTIVERSVVCHVDVDEYLSHASIMSYRRNNFLETDAMFLEFEDDLDNLAEGIVRRLSSQPPATLTLRRRVQSRELEHHIAVNGRILMTIAFRAEKPISLQAVRFN